MELITPFIGKIHLVLNAANELVDSELPFQGTRGITALANVPSIRASLKAGATLVDIPEDRGHWIVQFPAPQRALSERELQLRRVAGIIIAESLSSFDRKDPEGVKKEFLTLNSQKGLATFEENIIPALVEEFLRYQALVSSSDLKTLLQEKARTKLVEFRDSDPVIKHILGHIELLLSAYPKDESVITAAESADLKMFQLLLSEKMRAKIGEDYNEQMDRLRAVIDGVLNVYYSSGIPFSYTAGVAVRKHYSANKILFPDA
jgi:hypothetical protein